MHCDLKLCRYVNGEGRDGDIVVMHIDHYRGCINKAKEEHKNDKQKKTTENLSTHAAVT